MSITWNSKIHFKPNYKQDHKIFWGEGISSFLRSILRE